MFLLLLIIFPLFSYLIFNKYKDNLLELNGISKVIGLMGLFLYIVIILSDVFYRSNSYLKLMTFWYILVFFFFYFYIANIQFKNVKNLVFVNTTFSDKLMKLFFMIGIFIFFMMMGGNYEVRNSLDIFNSDFNLLNVSVIYFVFIVFCGLVYELIDVLKFKVLSSEVVKDNYRTKLKNELKSEILSELNLNK
ncbi:MAG: hypothetical protein PHN31_04385 [Candidatus Gracilibacteria bacterium]|nr:hypothetical protein [Candidatus Gracilibacteria bacterium]